MISTNARRLKLDKVEAEIRIADLLAKIRELAGRRDPRVATLQKQLSALRIAKIELNVGVPIDWKTIDRTPRRGIYERATR